MTAIDLTTLETIQDLTFNDFKAAHTVGNNVAVAYYNRLAYEGAEVSIDNIEIYGNYAKNVANNSGNNGIYANSFAKSVADDNSITYTIGSDNWLRVQYDLMRADYQARNDNVTSSGTGEIDYGDIIGIHEAAFDNIGLPPDAFSLHTPLTLIAEKHGDGDAQDMFEKVLPGDGVVDLMIDGLSLYFHAALPGKQDFADKLRGWADQADWIEAAIVAGDVVLDNYPTAYLLQDALDKYQNAADISGSVWGTLADWAEDVQDLADSYGGGFNIPTSLFGQLPDWIDDALTPWGSAPSEISPLILDMDSDGIEVTTFNAATTTTFFDIDNDGFAEQTAWVGADDGLLVRDVNANGIIDNSAELFGSATVDGFAILQQLDSNGDLIIDQYDGDWTDLMIWQDANGDAISQASELKTLGYHDIVSIDLAGVNSSTTVINGNPISHTSTFKYDDGSTDEIVDAWFVHDQVNTQIAEAHTVDIRTLFLPTLRGFGEVADLHVAMSQDAGLMTLVEDFVAAWDYDVFVDPGQLRSDIEEILYEWGGVDGVAYDSRGPNIDARRLEFMEKLFGKEFLQDWNTTPDPGFRASDKLMEAWEVIIFNVKAQLNIQAGGSDLFGDQVFYNVFSGELDGTFDLSETTINSLVSHATEVGVDTDDYWVQIAELIEYTKGLDNVTATEEGWLDTALSNSGLSDTWQDIDDAYNSQFTTSLNVIDGTASAETITGTTGDDSINGHNGYDLIYGGEGHDVLSAGLTNTTGAELYGESGKDTVTGSNYADVLSSGSGGDIVYGKGGDDIYIYTSGDDVYIDGYNGGADTIRLPTGIALGDLNFYRTSTTDLAIDIGTLGTIQITNQYSTGSSHLYAIEEIEFTDSSTFDLLGFTALDAHGSDANENIGGLQISTTHVDDSIYGHGGDDDLWGYSGDDTLDGGTGNDKLQGGYDDDGYVVSEGFDQVIEQNGSADKIIIPEGYTVDDVSYIRNLTNPNDLTILVEGLGQITIDDQFFRTYKVIEDIEFLETSTTYALDEMSFETRGGDGNDYLTGITIGGSSDDILNGMAGDDQLSGNAGNDTYIFSEGTDKVYEGGGTSDRILFWEAWNPQDITIYQSQVIGYNWNDLVLEDTNGNKIVVNDHFTNSNYTIEYVDFHDSTQWDVLNMSIDVHGTSGGDSITIANTSDTTLYGFDGIDSVGGGSGNDHVYGGNDNDYLYGNAGNDVLYGEAGNDTLYGGAGNDIYVYDGQGLDVVREQQGGDDTLLLTNGLTINDLTLSLHYGYNIKIVVNAGVDEIVVWDSTPGANSNYKIETITFDDGFTTALEDYASWLTGGSGNDLVAGNGNDNVMIGKTGNDTMTGGAGADLMHGGTGDDLLYGEDGLDTLFGGGGADDFIFESASAFNDVDVIKDFSTTDNDTIDITDVLDGFYDAGTDVLTDFVEITTNGANSELRVDTTGSASFGAGTLITTIEGVTGLTDEAALVTSGHLLAA